jgi:putative sterol carrier protein
MDLKEIFEEKLKNIPLEALAGVSEVFHIDLGTAGQYTIKLAEGAPGMELGLHGEPSCAITTNLETLQGLTTGKVNPMMAMMTGKLKISNPGVVLKYGKLLGLV